MEGVLAQAVLALQEGLGAPGGAGLRADPGEPAGPVAPGDGLDPVLVGLIGWPAVVLFGFLAVLLLSGSWAGRTGAVQGAPS